MRIIYMFEAKQNFFETDRAEIVFGRPKEGLRVDLDLSPDKKVSRPHGRIWEEDGKYWIEDFKTSDGTKIGEREIRGLGRYRLEPSAEIRVGDTTMRLDLGPESAVEEERKMVTVGSAVASNVSFNLAAASLVDDSRRLSLYYELPLHFGSATNIDHLLQRIVETIVDITPGAQRGALFLNARNGSDRILKAHVPLGQPSVSTTLARQAMESGEGLIWWHHMI